MSLQLVAGLPRSTMQGWWHIKHVHSPIPKSWGHVGLNLCHHPCLYCILPCLHLDWTLFAIVILTFLGKCFFVLFLRFFCHLGPIFSEDRQLHAAAANGELGWIRLASAACGVNNCGSRLPIPTVRLVPRRKAWERGDWQCQARATWLLRLHMRTVI